MDERDLKICRLQAQVEGQEQTIREQAEEIRRLEMQAGEAAARLDGAIRNSAEIRKELEEARKQLEDSREWMDRVKDEINNLIDKYRGRR